MLARATRAQSGPGSEHINTLRSGVRAFYPGTLVTLGTQLAEREALDVLELAPTPEQGRRLTRAAVRWR